MEIYLLFGRLSSKETKAVLTTKENAYGVLWQRWFDGEITYDNQINFNRLYEIKIVDVTEHHYIESTCTKDTYYQCLRRRFKDLEYNIQGEKVQILEPDGIILLTIDNYDGTCQFEEPCSSLSLPFEDNSIPICTDPKRGKNCYEFIWQHLRESQDKHCKKTCAVKDYQAKVSEIGFLSDPAVVTEPFNGYAIRYYFDLHKSTKALRSEKPFKTVKKEYYTMSLISLKGNVGGTLGMFIGFSFFGASEWILPILLKLILRIKGKEGT